MGFKKVVKEAFATDQSRGKELLRQLNLPEPDEKGALKLIAKGVSCKDGFGQPSVKALTLAVRKNCVEVVKALIDKKIISVDMQDDGGGTALIEACYYGKDEIVSALLERNAHVDITDDRHKSALNYAHEHKNNGIVLKLQLADPRTARNYAEEVPLLTEADVAKPVPRTRPFQL